MIVDEVIFDKMIVDEMIVTWFSCLTLELLVVNKLFQLMEVDCGTLPYICP